MQQTIEKLYNGEIHPCETLEANSKQYHSAIVAMSAAKTSLTQTLDPSQLAAFEAYLVAEAETTGIAVTQTFVNGFRLGAQLMGDILS